jgi:chromosome partitioning protein
MGFNRMSFTKRAIDTLIEKEMFERDQTTENVNLHSSTAGRSMEEAADRKFTATQIIKMFRIETSKQAMLKTEANGGIPTAARIMRGKIPTRAWSFEQLPEIGQRMGYLKKPLAPIVMSYFSLKGGTAKSTLAFQTARTWALHNVKTLVIGLDAQESITDTLKRTRPQAEAENLQEPSGIYHYLKEGVPLETLIQKTDLATLDYIPETIELSVLDVWLNMQKRKEYIFREKLIAPLLKMGYELIIFDCNPAWNTTVTSALAASDTLISPLGADINSLKATRIFTELLAEYQDDMNQDFNTFFIVPTMLEPNKLSQNVLARYRIDYEHLCTVSSIRRAIAVQEANLVGKSLLETAYDTPAYDDFVEVLKEISESIRQANTQPVEQRQVRETQAPTAEL